MDPCTGDHTWLKVIVRHIVRSAKGLIYAFCETCSFQCLQSFLLCRLWYVSHGFSKTDLLKDTGNLKLNNMILTVCQCIIMVWLDFIVKIPFINADLALDWIIV